MAVLTVTGKLVDFLGGLGYDDLPQDVIQSAKDCLLDTLGCILAGSAVEEMPAVVQNIAADGTSSEATVLGFPVKTSVFQASMLNGMLAHAVEMDDVHKRAKAHAGAVVIPAAISYGESIAASGKDLILSIVTGYEVMLRLGAAVNATEHRLQGWHATSTCGTFGAAAATAKLANLPEREFVGALGLAGTQSSGLWAFTADGANCKMFHAGHAASCGYMSLKMAASGIRGSSHIIEAKDGGFFAASSSNYDYEAATISLGNPFYITQVIRKPFACCRSMHPPIEAALRMRDKGIEIDQIKSIKVKTYEVAKIQCGFTNRPDNVADARFSIPYGIAVALYDGHALIDQFSQQRIQDRQVLALAEKVEIEVDPRYDSVYPNQWGCVVEMTMESGEIFTETVDDAKGDPVNPLSSEEIEQKFMYLSQHCLNRQQSLQIIERVRNLEQVADIGELIGLCILSK